ncbi:tRNA adenosine(34) deaminase TadA [Paraphotobacterium marinum]|uniref:tRNA-specific adenosine deaminase n=1 Tax=Paraphotobacterium marinum TaxID=1755811 RepID=A0A220VDL7_9GAMM|nr:tRNA adenosine(34) deaminase TadA [Paraphotobacterium marinum]ASK78455.1 tRNA adenosine(34) deaminase TadA [Paraphotobacterium marinum]
MNHHFFMKKAYKLAEYARSLGEVPVGAVLVENNEIFSEGWNFSISSNDCTAHAEIMALRNACLKKNNYRLNKNFSLYVTLEPCSMCLGALIHSRIGKIIYGASDPKTGTLGGKLNLLNEGVSNTKIEIIHNIEQELCKNILQDFFRARRKKTK